MRDELARVVERLDGAADDETARRYRSAHHCLRGLRGAPMTEVARAGNDAVTAFRPRLPDDAADLSALFTGAWEDGLVAVGLLATCVADSPREAFELGVDLAGRTDDATTADALGWLVLGPATLALGADGPRELLARLADHPRIETRRVVVAAALAGTPLEVEGAAAAPLRAVVGAPHLRIVDELQVDLVRAVVARFARDPALVKPVRRLVRVWGEEHPASLLAWADSVRGGLPQVLSAEVKRVRRSA